MPTPAVLFHGRQKRELEKRAVRVRPDWGLRASHAITANHFLFWETISFTGVLLLLGWTSPGRLHII